MERKYTVRLIKSLFKILTVYDIVLISVLLLLSISSLFLIHKNINSKKIEIIYQNKFFGEFSLDKDRIIKISDHIVIEVKDGKARIKENNCPNKICVKQGWSNTVPLICVPNKLVVRFVSKEKNQMLITY